MGFSANAYATIKKVDVKQNMTNCKITISKKDKARDKYVCLFAGWVSFVGNAHLCKPQVGQKIKITNCDVSNGYLDREGEQKFRNTPQFAIFGYELQGDLPTQSPTPSFAAQSPINFEYIGTADDLPF